MCAGPGHMGGMGRWCAELELGRAVAGLWWSLAGREIGLTRRGWDVAGLGQRRAGLRCAGAGAGVLPDHPCVLVQAAWVAWASGALGRSWAGPPLGGAGLGLARAGLGCNELELELVYYQSTHVCWSRQHAWYGLVVCWAGAGLGRRWAGFGQSWAGLQLELEQGLSLETRVCWPRQHSWHGSAVGWPRAELS